MKSLQYAYLAGLIDGDGSVSIYPRRDNKKYVGYDSRVGIYNTNLNLLQEIQKEIEIGVIYISCAKKKNSNTVYNLAIAGNQARDLLIKILPYLRLKKRHAELVIELQATKKRKGRKGFSRPPEILRRQSELHEEIKLLNKRGL